MYVLRSFLFWKLPFSPVKVKRFKRRFIIYLGGNGRDRIAMINFDSFFLVSVGGDKQT